MSELACFLACFAAFSPSACCFEAFSAASWSSHRDPEGVSADGNSFGADGLANISSCISGLSATLLAAGAFRFFFAELGCGAARRAGGIALDRPASWTAERRELDSHRFSMIS